MKNQIKILLLGAGDGGKSTFGKQLLYLSGTLKCSTYVSTLRDNCLDGAHQIVAHMNKWNIKIENLTTHVEIIENAEKLTPDVAEHVDILAKHTDIIELLSSKGNDMLLQGGVAGVLYYLQNALRYAADDFIPTTEDVFKSKIKTLGVAELHFEINGYPFLVVDVGGQRSARKKWISLFNSVTAVIFLTALNEYDMKLEEDEVTSRYLESIKLWKALTGTVALKNIPFMLFLNKSDLLREKLEKVPLQTIFPDFESYVISKELLEKTPFEQACSYFEQQYATHWGGSSDNNFVTHVTCAIDTENIKVVWATISDTIIERQLSLVGLLG